jgi:hypothetical protein
MTQANVLHVPFGLRIFQAKVEKITEFVNNALPEREPITEFAQEVLLAVVLLISRGVAHFPR